MPGGDNAETQAALPDCAVLGSVHLSQAVLGQVPTRLETVAVSFGQIYKLALLFGSSGF